MRPVILLAGERQQDDRVRLYRMAEGIRGQIAEPDRVSAGHAGLAGSGAGFIGRFKGQGQGVKAGFQLPIQRRVNRAGAFHAGHGRERRGDHGDLEMGLAIGLSKPLRMAGVFGTFINDFKQ